MTVRTGQSVGSGVVYKPDVVVTNEHVVTGSAEVTVNYADGSELGASVIAADPSSPSSCRRTRRCRQVTRAVRSYSPFEPNSPAAEAGARPGDVIVRFGDAPVSDVDDLFTALRQRAPGELVTVVVIRHGERVDLRVTLAARR